MKKPNKGYIGLVALMIVVIIIVFLMLNQYKSSGLIGGSNIKQKGSVDSKDITPVDQAKNAKNLLESLDKASSKY